MSSHDSSYKVVAHHSDTFLPVGGYEIGKSCMMEYFPFEISQRKAIVSNKNTGPLMGHNFNGGLTLKIGGINLIKTCTKINFQEHLKIIFELYLIAYLEHNNLS